MHRSRGSGARTGGGEPGTNRGRSSSLVAQSVRPVEPLAVVVATTSGSDFSQRLSSKADSAGERASWGVDRRRAFALFHHCFFKLRRARALRAGDAASASSNAAKWIRLVRRAGEAEGGDRDSTAILALSSRGHGAGEGWCAGGLSCRASVAAPRKELREGCPRREGCSAAAGVGSRRSSRRTVRVLI